MKMFSCKKVTKLVSESMERPLSLRGRIAIRIHFMLCKYCVRFHRHMLALRNLGRTYKEDEAEAGGIPPDGLSPDARERIKKALAEDKGGDGAQ